MNLHTKEKQSHRHREENGVCQGRGEKERWIGSLRLTDANYYT